MRSQNRGPGDVASTRMPGVGLHSALLATPFMVLEA